MGEIASQLVVIAIVVGLFFVFREAVCWYWKLNELADNTAKNNELLSEILEAVSRDSTITAQCSGCGHKWTRPAPQGGDKIPCPKCGKMFQA